MSQPLTIQQYVSNKEMRYNLAYRYHGFLGVGYYLGDDVLAHEEIQEKYPIDDVDVLRLGEKYKGVNPDKTHVK